MTELYHKFVSNLKKRFGKYDEEHNRFQKTSNSEIARELGYSDAQFSRLINGSATEGEYQRANQNLARIIHIDKLEEELSKLKEGKIHWLHKPIWLYAAIGLIAIFLVLILSNIIYEEPVSENDISSTNRDATLKWAFETSFVNPYVSLDELPEDCNYPCYKYQGKWVLDENYKIPFFREQNGYHYLATEVNMYARCTSEASNSGNEFEGYEYQRHEIWYDKRELPIDSFLLSNNKLNKSYKELVFSKDPNFIKIAVVHTFFRNIFNLENNEIDRSGKVIGRDIEVIKEDQLVEALGDRSEVDNIKRDINRISNIRLEDFSKPISCDNSPTPDDDFNMVKDGDLMTFACQLTTNRVAFDYVKKYRLEDQYIKNTCRSSVMAD